MAVGVTDSNWCVNASDNEEADEDTLTADYYRPKGLDAVELFRKMEETGDIQPLVWKCPGRRPPTPEYDSEYETDDEAEASGSANANQTATASSSASVSAAAGNSMDFDFEEGSSSSLASTTPRRPLHASRELKGSARKKTTSFNSVISNMKRHRQMDAAKAARSTPTNSKS